MAPSLDELTLCLGFSVEGKDPKKEPFRAHGNRKVNLGHSCPKSFPKEQAKERRDHSMHVPSEMMSLLAAHEPGGLGEFFPNIVPGSIHDYTS